MFGKVIYHRFVTNTFSPHFSSIAFLVYSVDGNNLFCNPFYGFHLNGSTHPHHSLWHVMWCLIIIVSWFGQPTLSPNVILSRTWTWSCHGHGHGLWSMSCGRDGAVTFLRRLCDGLIHFITRDRSKNIIIWLRINRLCPWYDVQRRSMCFRWNMRTESGPEMWCSRNESIKSTPFGAP